MINNRYAKIYNKIIEQARAENRKKGNGVYYESHHILPKSLGGANEKENRVLLTAREHFVCHRLLIRMTEGAERQSMAWALHRLTHIQWAVRTSREYRVARETLARELTGQKMDAKRLKQHQVAITKSWENANERRQKTSLRMKKHWEQNRTELLEISRDASKLGAAAMRLKYKGTKRTTPCPSGAAAPNSKHFILRDSGGNEYDVDCLKTFCMEHNLDYACMIQVSRGKNKQHKGFVVVSKDK